MRRPGAVLEDVSQVGITVGAKNLCTAHEKALVRFSADILARDRLREAGPATAGIEFGVGIEERRTTTDAGVGARLLAVVVGAGKGALGALLARNAVPVSYTHLRAHETRHDLVCRLLLE